MENDLPGQALSNGRGSEEKFYSISEAARLLGIHPSTLRLWESQGLISPARTPGGDRRYRIADLQNLLSRKSDGRLKENGGGVPPEERSYTISEAARILGVHPSTLRLWEQQGRISPQRTPGGDRRYRAGDTQNLLASFRQDVDQRQNHAGAGPAGTLPPLPPKPLSVNPSVSFGEGGPLQIPVRLMEHYRLRPRYLFAKAAVSILGVALAAGLWLQVSDLTKERIKRAFSPDIANPIVDVNDVLEYSLRAERIEGLKVKFPLLADFLEVSQDALFNTARFLGTIFFGEGTDYFITLTGDASLNEISASLIETSNITISGKTIQEIADDGGDADTLEGEDGNYYLAWGNFSGTPTILSSLDGVTNNEGDINLIAGTNIIITPDDGANTITFDVDTSGLDADTLDGLDSLEFLRSNASDSYTSGTLTFNALTILDLSAATLALADGQIDESKVSGEIESVTAGSGLTGGGTAGAVSLSHEDTSSQSSADNTGGNVIQDIALDTFGHITALASIDLDARYYTETETAGLLAAQDELSEMEDVSLTSADAGDYLRYSGAAWVDVGVSQVLTDLLTVDGAGSGLDADLLDGQTGSYYLAWANTTGKPNIVSSVDGVINNEGNIDLLAGANITITPNDVANTITFDVTGGGGSGLDADTLDTLDSTQFLRSDTGDAFTSGTLTLDAGTTLSIAGDLAIADAAIALTGGDTTFDLTAAFTRTLTITNSNVANVANLLVEGNVSGNTLTSTVAIGTAPFTVTSTTLVTNLNADLLDSQTGSYYLSRANHTGTQTAATISDFNEASQDSVGGILTDTTTLNFTYNDAGNLITADVLAGGIDHGSLAGLGDDDHAIYLLASGARALSGDWNQTGAFDIVLNNSASELKILESGATPTLFGILDVGDLSTADSTYTFSGASGTVWTSGNDGAASGLDADLLDAQDGSYYLSRANHTGTQTAATISDFNEASQDSVGGILTDTATLDFTYNDAGNLITADVLAGGIDHGSLAGLGDDDHPQYLLAAGTRALTGNWDAGSFEIRAQTFQSDVLTGTAPFTVTSTTLVTNLNADLLDSQSGSYYLDLDNETGTCANCLTTTEIDESTFTGLNSTNISDIYLFNSGDTIAGNLTFEKTGTATAGTQYPSYDAIFQGSGWNTTTLAAVDLTGRFRTIAGSGATGAIPYRLGVFDNTPTEFVSFDLLNQRVGIGTDTPGAKLDILSTGNDQLRISYNSTNYWDAYVEGDGQLFLIGSGTAAGMYVQPNDDIFFDMNSHVFFLYGNPGGIGLSMGTPAAEGGNLAIYRNGTGNLQLLVDADAAESAIGTTLYGRLQVGSTAPIVLQGDNATISTTVGNLTIDSAGTLVINDNLNLSNAVKTVTLNNAVNALNFDSDTLSIDALNNRIGIGTASPGYKLDVNGTIGFNGTTGGDNYMWEDWGFQFQLADAAGSYYWGIRNSSGQTFFNVNSLGTLHLGYANDTLNAWNGGGIAVGYNTNPGYGSAIFSGNVGIGTTGPGQLLDVLGTGAAGTKINALALELQRSGANSDGTEEVGLLFRQNNNAGPSTMYDSARIYSRIEDASPNGSFQLRFATKEHLGSVTDKMTILGGGNVGIGTTTPGAKLEVNGITRIGVTTDNTVGTSGTDGLQVQAINLHPNSSTDTLYMRYQGVAGNYALQTVTGGASNGNLQLQPYAGNVGIGTTDPTAQLTLNRTWAGTQSDGGTIDLNTTLSGTMYNTARISGGSPFAGSAEGYLTFWTKDSGGSLTPKMTINDLGNVGIGTTGPGGKLNVAGGNRTQLLLDRSGLVVGRFALFVGDGAGGYIDNDNYISGINNNLRFLGGVTGTTEIVTFLTSGNVGIGTTTPGAKLSIAGTAGHLEIGLDGNGPTAFIANKLGAQIYYTNSAVGAFPFDANGNLVIQPRTSASDNNGIAFATASGGSTTPTAKMVILSSGNVGIGTTGPVAKLDVNGSLSVGYNSGATTVNVARSYAAAHQAGDVPNTTNFGLWDGPGFGSGTFAGMQVNGVRDGAVNSYSLAFNTHYGGVSAGTRMTIDKSGNVGIGTAPGTELDISKTSANARLRIQTTTSGNPSIWLLNAGNAEWSMGLDRSDSSKFKIDAGSTVGGATKLTIQNDGNVGIGTTGPGAKLDVEYNLGAVPGSSPGLIVRNTAGTDMGQAEITLDPAGVGSSWTLSANDEATKFRIFRGATADLTIDGSGLVGIGRSPAANKLEVEGDASKTTAGDWLANSDIRIKTDVQTVENALEVIDQLRPVKFKYTEEYMADHPEIKDQYYYNFIAQEFQEVFPDAVQDSGDGYLQLDAYVVRPYLVAAVQELNSKIKELEMRIDGSGAAAQVNPDGSTTKISAATVKAEEGWFDKLTIAVEAIFEKITVKVAEIASAFIKKLTVESLAVKGDSIGQAVIPAGEVEISVTYPELTETSKVFFTLDRPVAVGVEKTAGERFEFTLASTYDLPVTIDYWVVEQTP